LKHLKRTTRLILVTVLAIVLAMPGLGAPMAQAGANQNGSPSLLEEVALARAIARLGLTNAQANRLMPLVEASAGRIKAAKDQAAASTARLKSAVEESRKSTLDGGVVPVAVLRRHRAAVQAMALAEERARLAEVRSLRAVVAGILTPEQRAAVQSYAPARQYAGVQGQTSAVQVGLDGASPDRMGQYLDRIRDAKPDRWQEMRSRLDTWLPGGPTGGDGATSDRRLTGFMKTADRVRAMSPEEYAQARPQLENQLKTMFSPEADTQTDGTASSATPRPVTTAPDTSLDNFIHDYLLHPAAVGVLWARIRPGSPSGGR
jgi:hypothetical protein